MLLLAHRTPPFLQPSLSVITRRQSFHTLEITGETAGSIYLRNAAHSQISVNIGTNTRGAPPDVSRASACLSILVANHTHHSRHSPGLAGGVSLQATLPWAVVSAGAI